MTAVSGILVIDKPEGLSSAAVVARIKRLSRAAKVLSLIHISEPTRQESRSRMPSSA